MRFRGMVYIRGAATSKLFYEPDIGDASADTENKLAASKEDDS
ncbi:MAG: hypothetical protein ACLQLC_03605 [Candidatus Sulfotelmatobacter sp.]